MSAPTPSAPIPSAPAASRIRWLAAAALAALPLGQAWSYEVGYFGSPTLTNQFNPYTGGMDLVPVYIPGTPGELVFGFQSPVRVFLLLAVVGSLASAVSIGSGALHRLAVGGLVGAFVLAMSAHEGIVVLALGLALVLVGGPLGHYVRARLLGSPAAPAPSPLPGTG